MESKLLRLLLFAGTVSAQWYGVCNPINTTQPCQPDKAFGAPDARCDLTVDGCGFMNPLPGTNLTHDNVNGTGCKMGQVTDAPTFVSDKTIFFGKVEVDVIAAPGAGIITSIVLISDDFDEIDFEFVGNQQTTAQSNFFAKGNTTTYNRGQNHTLPQPHSVFSRYGLEYNSTHFIWYINGVAVRTNLTSNAGAYGFPQTPMQVKLGAWVAGKPDAPPGTVQWAGGQADFTPGPVTAYFKNLTVVDYVGADSKDPSRNANDYLWSDNSGSYTSIQIQ